MRFEELFMTTLKKLLMTTICSGFATLGTVSRAQSAQIFYGDPQSLGNGTVRSWITVDDYDNPLDIGLTFDQDALVDLPLENYEYMLSLPEEAKATAFNHIAINWTPHGHYPQGIYGAPHFDFHFYIISPQERQKITLIGDDYARVYKMPSPDFIPTDYVLFPGERASPNIGWHGVDITSPEYHEQPFDQTFIYGFYNGNMIFEEPMITTAFLNTKPNITETLKLPAAYPKSAYYPTEYSVKYDEPSGVYTLSLDELKFRSASVPEPSSTLGFLAFGTFLGATSRLKRKQKKTDQLAIVNREITK
jgi:hypothetical protein